MSSKQKNIMSIRPGKEFAGIVELLELEAKKNRWSLNKFVLISLQKIITSNEQKNARPINGRPNDSKDSEI